MNYNLKLATPEDADMLKVMCLRFAASSPYRGMPMDIEEIDNTINSFIHGDPKEKVTILAMDSNGGYAGMVAGQATKMPFSKALVAAEIVWWVEPEARNSRASLKLLEAYEYWAKKVGCSIIQLSCLDDKDTDRITKFYDHRGYRQTEHSFLKEI